MRLFVSFCVLVPCTLLAQGKSATPPDTLVFANGEQLAGALVKADKDGLTFNSPMAGKLTVKWANVRELRTGERFAVLSQHVKLTRGDADAEVPVGTLRGTGTEIAVASAGGEKSVATANTAYVIDAAAFDDAVHHKSGLMKGWEGTATAGISLVRATEDSTTFNGNVALVRSTPAVNWLPPRTRSLLDYSQAYGTSSTAGVDAITGRPVTTTIESNIFHASAEMDRYFSPRLFGFGDVAFDHNFAQTLALQQAFGGGLGITVFNNARQELDAKADVHYEKQAFFDSTRNLNLFGSTFSERYLRHLVRGILLNEFASISPAWNNSSAYSGHANAELTFPVYKSVGFTLGAVDDYLNNAPPGSKKNSTEFLTGLTFTIKPR